MTRICHRNLAKQCHVYRWRVNLYLFKLHVQCITIVCVLIICVSFVYFICIFRYREIFILFLLTFSFQRIKDFHL